MWGKQQRLAIVPIGKVPGLKGQLGKAVVAQTASNTLAELQAVPRGKLAKLFPSKQQWLYEVCRGHDTTVCE